MSISKMSFSLRPIFWASVFLCSSQVVGAREFHVGSGIYDITGAAAEIPMMGYVRDKQIVDGIHMRQRARAFVIADPISRKRVVFVAADVGQLFQSVKLEVVKRLKQRYGAIYDHDNVMLTATHTHVGGSAGPHYGLYLFAARDTAGAVNFNAIVSGIVAAIDRAHTNLAPGSIDWVESELDGVTRNRSLEAYRANPDAKKYTTQTNTTMTQLNLHKGVGGAATPIGLINWFGVHPTSFSNRWTKISGDSKGYASQFFERLMGSDYSARETFVAAFSQGDVGDVVPVAGNAYSDPGYEGSKDELKNVELAARPQLDMARRLFNSTGRRLQGSIDYRHQWVRMPGLEVRYEYTGAGRQLLCSPARGFSNTAGGENGRPDIQFYPEGATRDKYMGSTDLIADDPCHWPKPVFLSRLKGLASVPEVLPFQIFKVGQLAIVGVPFEVTTMSARRLREQLIAELQPSEVKGVIIANMANTYSGYLTTFEEYQLQHYEGASTEFGPYSWAATRQILGDMAYAMNFGKPVVSNAVPPDKSGEWRLEVPGVIWDNIPWGKKFGDVLENVKAAYVRGSGEASKVRIAFRAAHPKNNIRTQSSFLYVERFDGSKWVTVAHDWDWETTYQWKRVGFDQSRVDIEWRIPLDTRPGTYRIRHVGNWKNGWNGAISEYTGISRNFSVR